MSGSLCVTLLTLLPTVTGLLNVAYPLPAPWSDPEVCGSPSAPTAALHNQTICDPDHLLSPYHRLIMTKMLAKCSKEAVMNTRIIVFLAANLSFPDERTTKPEESPEERLLDMIVASYNLTSQSSVVQVLAIKDQFKLALWQSPSLSSVLTNEARQEALNGANAIHNLHESLSASVSQYIFTLCKKIHRDAAGFTTEEIVLTIFWIVFSTFFVLGIIGAAIFFIRLRRSRFKSPQGNEDNVHSAPGQANASTLSGDVNDINAVSYRSTGHVLLGTTDITAVSAQKCASTDNLLET